MDKEKIGLLARAITTVIVAVIGVLAIMGVNVPVINENAVTMVISAILYVAVLAWNHWKNNNYTEGAKLAQRDLYNYKSMIKNEVDEMGKGGESHE